MRPRAASGQAGFALPAVLLLLAVVSLVLLTVVQAVRTLGVQARETVDQTRFETLALSLQARAAFAVATAAPGADSLALDPATAVGRDARLRVDGQDYAAGWGEDLLLSVQDEAGLINVDALTPAARQALFLELGATPPQARIMADRLGDFLDPDHLRRPDGAEALDYAQAGLPPPADGPAPSLSWLPGVMGWSDVVDERRWRALRGAMTADPFGGDFNPNTAPPTAMRVMYGLAPSQVQAVMARRRTAPFASMEAFGRAAGVRLVGDAERVYGLPNGRFVATVTSRSSGLRRRVRILLTPEDQERPIWTQEARLEVAPADERTQFPRHAPPVPFAPVGAPDPGRPARPR